MKLLSGHFFEDENRRFLPDSATMPLNNRKKVLLLSGSFGPVFGDLVVSDSNPEDYSPAFVGDLRYQGHHKRKLCRCL